MPNYSLAQLTAKDLEDLIVETKATLLEVVNESKTSLLRIESELKKVSDGTRVSARTFEKYDVDQLRPLVATLFQELHSCKDQLSKSVDTLESEFNYWSYNPTYLRDALTHLKTDEIIMNFDKHLLKIEQSHIDLSAQFKCQMTELEQLKTSVTSQPPLLTQAELQQCHSIQLKELKDLTTAINSQPKPLPPVLDYTKIKFPPLPPLPPPTKQPVIPSPATIRKEIRNSQDAERRKCNVIVRGLKCDTETDPDVAAKAFLNSCNIENFNLYQNDLVTAHILNKQGDKSTIRVVFNNHWTADNVLNSAHRLKKCPNKLYQTVYIAKDRTDEEMKHHRKLVSELKLKIAAQPTNRWVIQNDEIVNKGLFC